MKVSHFAFSMALALGDASADWYEDVEQHARRLCSSNVGDGCWTDRDCCGSMECLGFSEWQCGNYPGLEGEYCNLFYACANDLVCHDSLCRDYTDVLIHGTSGTCKGGNVDKKFKMMTYNVFLLNCLHDSLDNVILACQSNADKAERVSKLAEWFDKRDEDVVVLQEVFSFRDEVIAAMAEAGFCHYVTTYKGQSGSGLGIFSKWPIGHVDFMDWFDGLEEWDNPEAYADKGVMYAEILKDSTTYHVFNTHTQSNSVGDEHELRMKQYGIIRDFVQGLDIPSDEMILLGGDFNEDKWHIPSDYNDMLRELHAGAIPITGEVQHSQDTERNKLLESLWEGDETWEEYEELLDYVHYSRGGITPDSSSFCEIIIPQSPEGCNDAICMLSDHFPNTCSVYTDGFFDGAIPETPPPNTDRQIGEPCMHNLDCATENCNVSKQCGETEPHSDSETFWTL